MKWFSSSLTHRTPLESILSLCCAALITFALSGPALPVQAAPATLLVDTTTDSNAAAYQVCDSNPTNDNCSLRGAISLANSGGTYQIELPSRIYTLTLPGEGENINESGDLDVYAGSALIIHGADEATTIIDAGDLDRVIDNDETQLTIENVTIRNGQVSAGMGGGGGINNKAGSILTLTNVIIENNRVNGDSWLTDVGGGIRINTSDVTISRSIIRNNNACEGGGIYMKNEPSNLIVEDSSIAGNTAHCEPGDGGGLLIEDNTSATIRRSTFSGNTALFGAGLAILAGGNIQMINDTVANNSSTNRGGGVFFYENDSAILNHVTIADNTAAVEGPAIDFGYNSTSIFRNSIITSTTLGATCLVDGTASVTSDGYNILRDSSCFSTPHASDLVADPVLGVLGEFGGYTKTIPLHASSPAIDGVLNTDVVNIDQRSWPRVDGDRNGSILPDIGAFEYSPVCWLGLIMK